MKKVLFWIGGIIGFIFVFSILLPSTPNVEQVKNDNSIIPKKTNDVVKPNATSTKEIIVTKSVESNEITSPIISNDSKYKYYSVTSVVDGDTIKINIDGIIKTLRLIGIDTPETVDPRKPVQCFGKEASSKAKELLSGKKVRIEKDPTQGELDKYGRTLTYVYREDGLFYNKYMIEQGYAHEYTYKLPYKYQAEFKQAQKLAQTNLVGLWSPNTCNGDTSNTVKPASTGKYYASSASNASKYYPDTCPAWKSLSKTNLRTYNSLAELLAVYPNRQLAEICKIN